MIPPDWEQGGGSLTNTLPKKRRISLISKDTVVMKSAATQAAKRLRKTLARISRKRVVIPSTLKHCQESGSYPHEHFYLSQSPRSYLIKNGGYEIICA